MLFTLVVTTLTGLVFEVVPAIRAIRGNIIESAKESGRGATDSAGRLTVTRTLAAAQIAISLLLVIGSGLFFAHALEPSIR